MLQIVLVAASISTALLALLALFFSFRASRRPFALPPDQIAQITERTGHAIRTESDRLRIESQDQGRALRQEVAENVRGFQTSVLEAFRALGDPLQEQMRSLDQTISQKLSTAEERSGTIARKIEEELLRLATSANEAQNALRARIEAKLDAFGERSANTGRELRTDLTAGLHSFVTAVNNTLQQMSQQQRERLEALDLKVRSLIEQQGKAQETLRQSVEGRLDVLRNENVAKLEEMRRTVDEKLQTTLEARLTESFKLVSQQLESVHKGLGEMQTLAAGVGDLKKVLSNVKVRGTWGEIQLGNLLEQFLSPDQYIKNAQIREDSYERVEYAIRMPGRGEEKECLMPIDAKFPQEDYARLVAAAERGDGAAVEAASLALEARVKGFARSIQEKYIVSPRTTDFAILFLPTESLYAEMLRRPGLFESLQRDSHVLLAGPTTLAAMLNAFQMGFKSLAIEKRSSEVWQVLGAVRTEFDKHGDVVATLRKQLGAAVNTVDKLGTRTRAMTRTLRDIDTVPSAQASALLSLTAQNAAADDAAEAQLQAVLPASWAQDS